MRQWGEVLGTTDRMDDSHLCWSCTCSGNRYVGTYLCTTVQMGGLVDCRACTVYRDVQKCTEHCIQSTVYSPVSSMFCHVNVHIMFLPMPIPMFTDSSR